MGRTVIYDIEHGKETVRLSTLLRLLEALNITFTLESPLMPQFEATGQADTETKSPNGRSWKPTPVRSIAALGSSPEQTDARAE